MTQTILGHNTTCPLCSLSPTHRFSKTSPHVVRRTFFLLPFDRVLRIVGARPARPQQEGTWKGQIEVFQWSLGLQPYPQVVRPPKPTITIFSHEVVGALGDVISRSMPQKLVKKTPVWYGMLRDAKGSPTRSKEYCFGWLHGPLDGIPRPGTRLRPQQLVKGQTGKLVAWFWSNVFTSMIQKNSSCWRIQKKRHDTSNRRSHSSASPSGVGPPCASASGRCTRGPSSWAVVDATRSMEAIPPQSDSCDESRT